MNLAHAVMVVLGACHTLVLAANAADARPSLRLEGLSDVVPSMTPPLVESHGRVVEAINIALGDPVGIRVTLENTDDTPTSALTLSFNPGLMPAVVVVVHPDGRESLSALDSHQIAICGRAPVRPLQPGEHHTGEFYIYTDLMSELGEKVEYEYLFPVPGEYQLYIAYFTQAMHMPPDAEEGRDVIQWTLDRIRDRNTTLVSNTVRVRVGPPAPVWEQLRTAGIARAMRRGGWVRERFAQPDWREQMETLVTQADRPWLTAWYAKQKAAALEAAATLENHSSLPPESSQDEDPAAAQGGGS